MKAIEQQIMSKHLEKTFLDILHSIGKSGELEVVNNTIISYLKLLVDMTNNNCNRIIELGCGSGHLALLLLQHFKSVEIISIDNSDKMINDAFQKIFDYDKSLCERIKFIECDLSSYDSLNKNLLEFDYADVIVSSLTLHHILPNRKAKLFKQLHEVLSKKGFFINGDIYKGANKQTESLYRNIWDFKLKQDFSEKELQKRKEHRTFESPTTMKLEKEYLMQSGFSSVSALWKELIFGVLLAVK